MSQNSQAKNKWHSQFVSKQFKNKSKTTRWRHHHNKQRYKKSLKRKQRHDMNRSWKTDISNGISNDSEEEFLSYFLNSHEYVNLLNQNEKIQRKHNNVVDQLIDQHRYLYQKNKLLLSKIKQESYISPGPCICPYCVPDFSEPYFSNILLELPQLLLNNPLIQQRNNKMIWLLIEGYMRSTKLQPLLLSAEIAHNCFKFYCYSIKLIFINTGPRDNICFDDYMTIAVNDDFLIHSLQCQLENDFAATAENKICLWFKYNSALSALSHIHFFPDIRKNHWITIPDNFTKNITIGDIGVDSNLITILVDIRLESHIDNMLDTSGLYYKTKLIHYNPIPAAIVKKIDIETTYLNPYRIFKPYLSLYQEKYDIHPKYPDFYNYIKNNLRIPKNVNVARPVMISNENVRILSAHYLKNNISQKTLIPYNKIHIHHLLQKKSLDRFRQKQIYANFPIIYTKRHLVIKPPLLSPSPLQSPFERAYVGQSLLCMDTRNSKWYNAIIKIKKVSENFEGILIGWTDEPWANETWDEWIMKKYYNKRIKVPKDDIISMQKKFEVVPKDDIMTPIYNDKIIKQCEYGIYGFIRWFCEIYSMNRCPEEIIVLCTMYFGIVKNEKVILPFKGLLEMTQMNRFSSFNGYFKVRNYDVKCERFMIDEYVKTVKDLYEDIYICLLLNKSKYQTLHGVKFKDVLPVFHIHFKNYYKTNI
eukprot:221194_1